MEVARVCLDSLQYDFEKNRFDYNMLLLNNFLLVVHRTADSWTNGVTKIGLNSMGYAGGIVVKSEQDLNTVKELGPLKLLEALAMPIN